MKTCLTFCQNIHFIVETLEVNALVPKYKYSDSEEITYIFLVFVTNF